MKNHVEQRDACYSDNPITTNKLKVSTAIKQIRPQSQIEFLWFVAYRKPISVCLHGIMFSARFFPSVITLTERETGLWTGVIISLTQCYYTGPGCTEHSSCLSFDWTPCHARCDSIGEVISLFMTHSLIRKFCTCSIYEISNKCIFV